MTELELKKQQLCKEIDRRTEEKILESTNAELLKKLINSADDMNEAMSIASLGTIWKQTGLHFDVKLEKGRDNNIRYFKKNKELSFHLDDDLPTHKLIIGDNYDALQNLLIQYKGKIDVIYIDPPYGKDSLGEFAKTNYDNAISRDNLLSMLYPRLLLAKELMSSDGVIFCSIDDRNQSYVKCLFDEIWGESAFLFNVPRQTIKGGKTTKTIYKNHDYVLAYTNNREIQFSLLDTDTSSYDQEDEFVNERGKYKTTQTLDYDSLTYSPGMDYVLEFNGQQFVPGSDVNKMEERKKGNYAKQDWNWRWSSTDIKWAIENKLLVLKNNRIYTKTYEKCRKVNGKPELQYFDKKQQAYSSLMYVENTFSNNKGKKDLADILPDANRIFKNPKPVALIKALIDLVCTNSNAIVLDFFAGSGTTGQAVFEFNKTKNRMTFIGCQINEKDDLTPNGIAYDVTSKRLRRILAGECYDGTADFGWLKDNTPYGENLDVYDIESVPDFQTKEGETAIDVIDETLYGEKFSNIEDKINWVCANFKRTETTLTEKN